MVIFRILTFYIKYKVLRNFKIMYNQILIVHNFKVKLFVIYVKCLWTSKD